MILRKHKRLVFLILSILILSVSYRETTPVIAADPPTLLTPIHSASLNDSTPTATWTAVSGALSYDIELGADSVFDVSYGTENVPGTSYTPSSPLPDGTYWWRVRTVDNMGAGDWSAARRFYIDTENPGVSTAVSPVDDSYVNDSSPLLDWTSASGAYEYNIVVDNSITFVSPFVDTFVFASEYQLPTLTENQFFWKVQARDKAGNIGSWSPTYDFTVDITPPGSIALYSPSNGTRTDDPWAYETYSDPDAVLYLFEFGNNPSFDIIYERGTNENPIYAWDEPDGDIYWHACAIDRAGNYGPWSETWVVTIDATGPTPPIPLTPANNSFTTDTFPRFEWSITESAVQWEGSISYNNFASWWTFTVDGAEEYHDYTGTELGESLVYWRIRGRDDLWNWGQWSETMVFTVDITPPEAVTLVSPADEEIISDNTPTFNWEAVEGAVVYRVVMDNNDDWSSLEIDIFTDNLFYVVPSELADGTYYWNVRAIDAADNWGDWGTPWSFTVDTVIIPEFNTVQPSYLYSLSLLTIIAVSLIIKKKKRK